MIPHEGQGNGRAELLDSTILNPVLHHNQHFAFLFLPISFFPYISSFSFESTRVFDLIAPRWPHFPVHLVGFISFLSFLLSSEEISSYSLSFPPDCSLSPFSSVFFFF